MRVSYHWLSELLPRLSESPAAVAELLTMHSYETALVREQRIDRRILTARISVLKPHPNADRLRLATVDTGTSPVTVVCGAPNISEGDIVPFAPPGSQLSDEHGHSVRLVKARIRGVESTGMLASVRELGLGVVHDGIYLLPPDTPVGKPLAEYIPDDTLLDLDLTPNRAHDSYSHLGVARELAAILRLEVAEPDLIGKLEKLAEWSITVADPADTPRYLASVLEDIRIEPSPLWLQARLWAVGAKPINNVVDVTNYVLFELGNPTHAFDAGKLSSKTIGTRLAKPGETIAALDGNTYALTADDLVVTAGGPIAIAGAIGGAATQVDGATTKVVLEAANFRGYQIQETDRRLKLGPESAVRFKKGITPQLAEVAARRAIKLLQELAGATYRGTCDHYPRPGRPTIISLNPAQVTRIAGVSIAPDETKAALQRLRCRVDDKNTTWAVAVPSDRLDLAAEHDLVEEVIRLIGLEKIPAKSPGPVAEEQLSGLAAWRELVRDTLWQLGHTETYNFSFGDEKANELTQWPPSTAPVAVANPPSPEQRYLRGSLVPQIAQQLLRNRAELIRPQAERSLFEVGTVFRSGEGAVVPGVVEEERVAAVTIGSDSLPRARAAARAVVELFGLTEETDKFGGAASCPPPARLVKKLRQPVAYFELSLTRLAAHTKVIPVYRPKMPGDMATYQPIAKYPAVYRDISVLVDHPIGIERVQEVIERAGGELVVEVDLFDVYDAAADSTATTASPRQSLAFHLTYQSRKKTLTDDEVDKRQHAIVTALKKELGADIRG
jgi:phenylalanyl-tRNA synthetase beta chain